MMFTKPSVEHFIVLFTVASKSLLSYGETAATNVGNLRGDIKEEQEDKIVKDDIILDQVLEGILSVSSLTKDVGMARGLNMASATTKSNGKVCTTDAECSSGYCVESQTVVQMKGVVQGPYKMCVECLSDYDCPSSISCNNPLTPLAMCDWGSQKTFPGIDNIRKGYDGFKSDPLMYKSKMDPGWTTEGFVLEYDYMKGASSFTMDNELWDVPAGYNIDVQEMCSLALKTDQISSMAQLSGEISASVEASNDNMSVGASARAAFSEATEKHLTTRSTVAECTQYIIELDVEQLSEMNLDGSFKTYLNSPGFSYEAMFKKKGTHFVTKAYVGSKFGITQTISEENKKQMKEGEVSVSGSMENVMTGMEGSAEASASFKAESEASKYSESMNSYTIGSNQFGNLETWAESSKLNPEIVNMKVESLCELLDVNKDKEADFNNFTKEECDTALAKYTFESTMCYNVQIKTCEVSNGGTDADIYLSIYGDRTDDGKQLVVASKFLNDKIKGDAFEQGDVDTIVLCGLPNVGTISKIGLQGGWDTWKPQSVTINGMSFNYGCSEVENEEVKRESSDPLKCYDITIVTDSDCSWSGTDSNIYLTLYGTEQNPDGRSKEIRDKKLNHLIDGNAFESGDTDFVQLCGMPNIGEITHIGVRGGGDTWDPIMITVDTKQFKFSDKCPGVGENEVTASPV